MDLVSPRMPAARPLRRGASGSISVPRASGDSAPSAPRLVTRASGSVHGGSPPRKAPTRSFSSSEAPETGLADRSAAPSALALADVWAAEAVAPSAWRVALAAQSLNGITLNRQGLAEAVQLRSASSARAMLCSTWALHDARSVCVFGNAGAEDEDAVLLDVLTNAVVARVPMPTATGHELASTAALNGSMLVFGGASGAAHAARVADWGSVEEWRPSWQRYTLARGDGALDAHLSTDSRLAVDFVVCSPGEKAFASAENASLHLWDYHRVNQPLHSVPIWQLGCRTSAASVDPETGTVCLLGSTLGRLQMVDYRVMAKNKTRCSVWIVDDAHAAGTAVRDVRWHPQVAHLLASCGDDGHVRVWDARSQRSALMCIADAHAVGAAHVAWSLAHPELLGSAGLDSSMHVWNLRLSSEERMVASAPLASPVRPLGLGWAGTSLVLGDCNGSVTTAALGADFLRPMCPARPQLASEAEARELLYVRNLERAFAAVVARVTVLTNAGDYGHALELVQLCYPRPARGAADAAAVAGAVSSDSPALLSEQLLRDDLTDLAAFVPPRLPVPPGASSSLRTIKKLRLLLNLHQLKAKGQWREAFQFTDKLCKYYRKSSEAGDAHIQPAVLRDTVALVLDNHYLSGLQMGAKVLHAMSADEYVKNAPLTRLLLSPTVFDGFAGGAAQAGTDLDHVLANQKVGLSQVDFVLNFTNRLWGDAPFERVEKMMRKTEQSLISLSATVNRIYLLSLAQNCKFLKLIAVYATLSAASAGCIFSTTTLPRLLVQTVLPLMDDWAQAVCDEAYDEANATQLVMLASQMLLRENSIMPQEALAMAGGWLRRLASKVPGQREGAKLAAVVQQTSNVLQDDAVKAFLAALRK